MKFYRKPLCRPCQCLERNVNEYTITAKQEKEIDKLASGYVSILLKVIKSFGYYQVNLILKKDYQKIFEKLEEEIKEVRLHETSYRSSSYCCGSDNLDIALEAGIGENAIWG
jgi:hypothetical protein